MLQAPSRSKTECCGMQWHASNTPHAAEPQDRVLSIYCGKLQPRVPGPWAYIYLNYLATKHGYMMTADPVVPLSEGSSPCGDRDITQPWSPKMI